MKKLIYTSIIGLFGILFSCEQDATDPNVSNGLGTMTALVDGDRFNADLKAVASHDGTILTVTGSGGIAEQCQVILQDFNGEGSYTLGGSMTATNNGRWTASINPQSGTYLTQGGLGDGACTITSWDGAIVKGTFNFTAKNLNGEEAVITEGEFHVEIEE